MINLLDDGECSPEIDSNCVSIRCMPNASFKNRIVGDSDDFLIIRPFLFFAFIVGVGTGYCVDFPGSAT